MILLSKGMPNDCSNFITITGDEETISLLHNTKFDFNFFIPAPPSDEANTILTDDEIIKWRYDNWGTKWAPYEYKCLQKGKRGMRVSFKTAWYPPQQFLEFLLQKYPDLWIKCEWHEESGRAGVLVGENRELQSFEWEDLSLEEEVFVFEED